MVYPKRMAKTYTVQYLEECLLDQVVISNVVAPLGYTREQVAFGAVFKHNESTVIRIHNLHQRHHIGMVASLMVELYLPLLKSSLSRIQADLVQSLDRISDVRVYVDRRIDHTVCTYTQDSGKLQTASK